MSTRIAYAFSLVVLGAALIAAPADAQISKIGYTNQQVILSNMPEMQNVQQQLQKAAKQQQQELQQEQQEWQKQMQQYQQQRSMLNDSARARRERQLRRQEQELRQSSQQRQQELRQREQELMQPLLKDLQSAINLVADRRGIDMVVRSEALLYVDQTSQNVVDITKPVAQELDINLDQAPSGPSPSVDPNTPPPTGGGGSGGGGSQK